MNRLLASLCFGTAAALALAAAIPVHAEDRADPEAVREMTESGIATSSNILGLKLLKDLHKKDPAKNTFISPYSISSALAMALNGAKGNTAKEIHDALQLRYHSLDDANLGHRGLRARFTSSDKATFNIANSLWMKQGEKFKSDFIHDVVDAFGASAESLKFDDPASVEKINKWIKDNTGGKIDKMLDAIPADAVMYAANAVYFKADWKYKFEKDRTYEGEFGLGGNKGTRANFMRRTGELKVVQKPGFVAASLPYADEKTSMILIVPNADSNLDALLTKLTPEYWASWCGEFSAKEDVSLTLPRLKIEYEAELVEPLKALGMKEAFTDKADFSGICDSKTFVSRVKHKSFVEVNEAGTEAAAATVLEWKQEAPEIRVDATRPFIFAIRDDKTGAFLFLGTVVNPGKN